MKFVYSAFWMFVALTCGDNNASAFISPNTPLMDAATSSSSSLAASTAATSSTWFASEAESSSQLLSIEKVKAQILQLGAALDRGQSYNPTSGEYYKETMDVARGKIENLLELSNDQNIPTKLEDIAGEWELVLSTVPHGIFRSSPFFLAIQESYEYAESNGK